jgi:hypothetical protein
MKFKQTVLLATFVVAMALLLGASTAQAAVETDGSGNVTRITNLPVLDEITEEIIIYNVDFVYDTADNVYGEEPEYDFIQEENIYLALEAVNDALNAEDTVPPAAGPQGTDDFFIGYRLEDVVTIAAGGENIAGFWSLCTTLCINVGDLQTGARAIGLSTSVTWADFTVAEEVAPGKATLISPSGTINDNTPTYTWNAVESSTYYHLQVNDSDQEEKILKWYTADEADCGDGTGECSVTHDTEIAGGKAKWWIRTWNDFGNGPWSDKLEFTVDTGTGELPEKTTLISPNGTISDNTPTYTWNAVENSTWYELWVQDSAGKKRTQWYTAEQADCGAGTGECSVTPALNLADDSHKWWIQTWNDAVCDTCEGPWSAGMSFTVTGTGVQPPEKATLISPSGTITENSPTYTWNAVENSTWYYLWVNDSTGDKKILKWYTDDEANCGDGTGECSVTPATELADGAAKWWIQTWNDAVCSTCGPWSAGMSFTVNTGTVDPGVNVETDGNGNVTRITNLPVLDEIANDTIIYNVDFVYDTADNVYGEEPEYDFIQEENIYLALEAVNDALNAEDTVPPAAGPQGTDDFFIGYRLEDVVTIAAGGENFAGFWSFCTTRCIEVGELQTGAGAIGNSDPVTWATFTEVD